MPKHNCKSNMVGQKRKYAGGSASAKNRRAPAKRFKRTKRPGTVARAKRGADKGHFDIAASNWNADTTGTIGHLNVIAQGASDQQRVGKKVIMRSIQLRGRAIAGSTGTVADGAFIMVWDKRPTGTLPAITDVLEGVSAQAMNKADNEGRFKILKRCDMIFAGNSTTPATGLEIQNMDFYMKLNMRTIFKSVGTGAIGDIEEGALYALSVGNVAAGTTAPIFVVAFRMRFTEE